MTIPIIPSVAAKGGVGKSTLTVNIAHCFAIMGLKPLIIDLDPQGSATRFLGNTHRLAEVNRLATLTTKEAILAELEHLKSFALEEEESVVNLLHGRPVKPRSFHNVGIVGYAHGANEQFSKLASIDHQEEFIEALNLTISDYKPDLVIIDTPPSNMEAGSFAISIATHIIVPLEATEEGLRGAIIADKQRQIINKRNVREGRNVEVALAGVVPMDIYRSTLCSRMIQVAKVAFGDVVTSQIDHATTIGEACVEGLPVIAYEEKMQGVIPKYQVKGSRFHKAGRQIFQVATEIGCRVGLCEAAEPVAFTPAQAEAGQ
jgi:chromosome partitioning protein